MTIKDINGLIPFYQKVEVLDNGEIIYQGDWIKRPKLPTRDIVTLYAVSNKTLVIDFTLSSPAVSEDFT